MGGEKDDYGLVTCERFGYDELVTCDLLRNGMLSYVEIEKPQSLACKAL